MTHNKISRYSKLLLPCFGLIAALLVGEIALRVISRWDTSVRYLAQAGVGHSPPVFRTFPEMLKFYEDQIPPHRVWRGYTTNSLGFQDREFEIPKPKGRLRIAALGDSFLYGMVPYPNNILTVAEDQLRAECPGKDFELLNLGIAGMNPLEYKQLFELSSEFLNPDLVVVHFYMGNDSPNLFHGKTNLLRSTGSAWYSFLYTFLKNAYRAYSSLAQKKNDPMRSLSGTRGGEKVDQTPELTDHDSLLKGPTYSLDAWTRVARDEIDTLYETTEAPKLWRPVFEVLEDLNDEVKHRGGRLAIVFLPSEFQVYPERIAEEVQRLREMNDDRIHGTFDPDLPSTLLKSFCERSQIPCFDLTPKFREAASKGETLYIERDSHWNITGNRLAGETEAQELRNLLCSR